MAPGTALRSVILIVATLAAPAAAHEGHADAVDQSMRAAAGDLLDALRPELREQIVFAFDGPERTDWHFIPKERTGVALKEMSLAERRAAHRLLRTALSDKGYLKATTIMSLERVLRLMEADAPDVLERRDPEKYWLAVYGDPRGDGLWGWRIEGHHLSLNFSSVTGRTVATFPAFVGANPAEVRDGPRVGLRALGEEEDVGRELMAALTEAQRGDATIATAAPRDILTAPGASTDLGDPAGVAAKEMTRQQRALLWRLITLYADNLRGSLAEAALEEIERAGIDNVRFAWAGGPGLDDRHYYRVPGPTVLLEFDKTEPNHAHAVWHSTANDFGLDALRRHYEESGHHRAAE